MALPASIFKSMVCYLDITFKDLATYGGLKGISENVQAFMCFQQGVMTDHNITGSWAKERLGGDLNSLQRRCKTTELGIFCCF